MLILLTNDDGIRSEGIQYLRRSLEEIANIVVIAPERERSATGHGITMHKPLRVNKVQMENEIYGLSVSGTPADCVKLALDELLEQTPDLVVSGINNGLNLGTDVLYSGTVSAAIEAAIANVPALAVSVEEDPLPEDYSYAADVVKKLVQELDLSTLSDNALLNINVPRKSRGPVNGIRITTQGIRRYENSVDVRKDPRGKEYYWLGGKIVKLQNSPDSDITACEDRVISLTPLQYDLTNYSLLQDLKKWKF